MKTIYISATQARKSFFKILERVVQENVRFIVENKNLERKVSIGLDKEQVKAPSSSIDLQQLYGSLKSTVSYQDDEKEQARQIYAKNQAEKYE